MKKLLIALTLLAPAMAHAENWQKILTCENGAVHVDVNTDARTNLQLVIQGGDLLSRLYGAGMVSLQFGQQEYLLRGDHAELRQTSPTYTLPQSLGGVFYPWDFKKMIQQDWNGNAVELELRGDTLAFKKMHYTQGESCQSYFEGECQGGVMHRTYYFDREFDFRGCQSN